MSKHHVVANAQKRKKRNKQKFWNRVILPRVLRKEEAKNSKNLRAYIKKWRWRRK